MNKKLLLLCLIASSAISFSSCGDTSENEANNVTEISTTTVSSYEPEESIDDNSEEYEDNIDDYNNNSNNDYYGNDYDDNNYEYEDSDYGASNPLTSFYDTLAQEYENNPEFVRLSKEFKQHEINGKLYSYELDKWNYIDEKGLGHWESAGYDCYLVSYDIDNNSYDKIKLFSSNQFPDKSGLDIVYHNDCIYVITDNRLDITDNYSDVSVDLCKFDLSGKKISTCNLGLEHEKISYISENGDVLVGHSLINSDFNNILEIPDYLAKVEHGVTEEKYPYIFGIYNNEIYAGIQLEYTDPQMLIFKYNLSAKEWSDSLYEVEYSTSYGQIIGKYAYIKSGERDNDSYTIFDMETGEILANINEVFNDFFTVNYISVSDEMAKLFKYGRSHIRIDDEWKEIRIYGDGSTSYDNYFVEMGYDNSSEFEISVVDGEHYTLTDSYGIFLRAFKNGESDELDIVRFDN